MKIRNRLIQDKNHENHENHLPLSTNTIRILSFYCMWRKGNLTLLYCVKFTLVIISFNIITAGLFGHLKHYLDYNPVNYLNIADDLAGIGASNSVMYMFITFLFQYKDARGILYDLGDFSRLEKPKCIEKVNKRMNFLAKIFAFCMALTASITWLICFMEKCEDGVKTDCGFIINAYLPFIDIFRSPHREIFMTLQIYSGFSSAICAFYIAWIYLSISEYIVVWLKQLKIMIVTIKTLKGRQARKLQIKKTVQYQYFILDIENRFNQLAKNIFIVHVTNSAVVMSMIMYQLLCQFVFVNAVHFSVWLAAVVVSCLYGERLISESSDLSVVIYNNIPEDGDLETKRDMLIILMGSSREMSIACGKFGSLSHLRLMAILKAMYSFLTLLAKSI